MSRLPSTVVTVTGITIMSLASACRMPPPATPQASTAERKAALEADMRDLDTAITPLPMGMVGSGLADESWVEIPVPYGTRRRPTGDATPDKYYGKDDSALQYGVAMVSIPARHRPGKEDSRGWCRHLPGVLECKKKPSNAVMVTSVEPRDADAWLGFVKGLANDGGSPNEILVFVHGYNNGFADAIRRIAQLSYDVGFRGVTVAYDWASRNELAEYTFDEATMERSVPDFERFLLRLVDSTGARRVSIIAHSMGTRLVSYALRDLHYKKPSLKLGQVILAAPDIDFTTFTEQLADPVVKTSTWVTLYASGTDRAIQASRALHNAKRVGSGPLPAILRPDMDYIDATGIDTGLLGHGYFAENRALITDIFLLLKHGLPAADRNLLRAATTPGNYFRFR